jgi:HK97 gp10 family phage protein
MIINIEINNKAFGKDLLNNKDMINSRTSLFVNRVAHEMKALARDYCPSSTGRLKNSIQVYRDRSNSRDTFEATVGTYAKYAKYVEYGTGIYFSQGLGRQTPWWYKDENGNFFRTRGQRPQFFMTRAFQHGSQLRVLEYYARQVFR